MQIKDQNKIFFPGKNFVLLNLVDPEKGIVKRMAIERTKAKTPPNLLGIDRRMA